MDSKKVVNINRKEEEYYDRLNKKYDDIEHIENEGKPMKDKSEFEDYKERKQLKEKGIDPDEELPY